MKHFYDRRTIKELTTQWEEMFAAHCKQRRRIQIDKGNWAMARNYTRFLKAFKKLYTKDPLALSYYIDNIYGNWYDMYYLYFYFMRSRKWADKKITHEYSKKQRYQQFETDMKDGKREMYMDHTLLAVMPIAT